MILAVSKHVDLIICFMNFFSQLQRRNPLLYWFGWLNFLAALVCIVMIQTTGTIVLGINAWIKPMKFYLSIGIFCWTMAWYLYHLQQQRAVRAYSWMSVIVFIIETVIITWQAANGRLSHFNVSTPLYGMLFTIMGIAITILALWTLWIAVLFFRQKQFDAPMGYIWGIRLGIVLFVIFSFEGGMMAGRLSHTVGAPDGSAGLPVLNWSREYGDLRIAHFFGMHALQLLPLLGYFVFRKKQQIVAVSIVYFLAVSFVLLRALQGIPLIG
jgi:hypothetical protein